MSFLLNPYIYGIGGGIGVGSASATGAAAAVGASIFAATGSASGVGAAVVEDEYEDAHVVMDFVAGVYRLNGATKVASDMIDKTDTIEGAGLFIDWNTHSTVPMAQAAVLAEFAAANWTMAIDVVEDDSGSMYPIYMRGSADFLYLNTGDTSAFMYDQPDPGADRDAGKTIGARPARRRIGVTRTNDRLSMSVNGSSIDTDTTATSTPSSLTDVLIGGDFQNSPFMYGHIERIMLYPPRSDADLILLSDPTLFTSSRGSAGGTGAATAVGASTAASAGSASAVGAAAANSGTTDGDGSASATGAATGVGASTAASTGSASGTGAASGVSSARRLLEDGTSYRLLEDGTSFRLLE